MKSIVNWFRSAELHVRVLAVVEALAIIVVMGLLTSENARAQAGNVYAPHQAQAIGEVWEAVVLQVSIKEVEPSYQARAAGAAVGGALGLALASRTAHSQHRFAANTVGAVVGGLIGERAANAMVVSRAQEILVRLQLTTQTARLAIIVQPLPAEPVAAGEVVYVTKVQGAYRVLPRARPEPL